jgi:hypothetical protein
MHAHATSVSTLRVHRITNRKPPAVPSRGVLRTARPRWPGRSHPGRLKGSQVIHKEFRLMGAQYPFFQWSRKYPPKKGHRSTGRCCGIARTVRSRGVSRPGAREGGAQARARSAGRPTALPVIRAPLHHRYASGSSAPNLISVAHHDLAPGPGFASFAPFPLVVSRPQ